MTIYDAQRILQGAAREGLPELSIENLKCGRITRQVMALMWKRLELIPNQYQQCDLYFADWLNDLLEAGQVVRHHERVTVCADAMNENEVRAGAGGQPCDDQGMPLPPFPIITARPQ